MCSVIRTSRTPLTRCVMAAGFHDLGLGFYADRIDPDRRKRNHIRQLEALGYKFTLQPAA